MNCKAGEKVAPQKRKIIFEDERRKQNLQKWEKTMAPEGQNFSLFLRQWVGSVWELGTLRELVWRQGTKDKICESGREILNEYWWILRKLSSELCQRWIYRQWSHLLCFYFFLWKSALPTSVQVWIKGCPPQVDYLWCRRQLYRQHLNSQVRTLTWSGSSIYLSKQNNIIRLICPPTRALMMIYVCLVHADKLPW